MRQTSARTNEDFPEPLAPTMANALPAFRKKLTSVASSFSDAGAVTDNFSTTSVALGAGSGN